MYYEQQTIDKQMYNWRKMSDEQRAEVKRYRRILRYPMHSPPHFGDSNRHCYHLSAANFEHASVLGASPARMAAFSDSLCAILNDADDCLHAWSVLPNHWHALVETANLKGMLTAIGRLHGRSFCAWNGEEATRGRQCWHGCTDRLIRSDSHFFAVRNYIHHNPVKHGYVEKWEDWPYSSAAAFIEAVGRDKALELWKSYPILAMGAGWDDY